jgi:hypothetical protein
MRSGEQVDVQIMTLLGLYDICGIIKVAGVRSCNMRCEIVKQVYFLILGSSRLFDVSVFAPLIIPLKTKRRLLNLKTQSVPRCKHFITVIKTNQFMLHGAEVAVCCQINTVQNT